MAKSFAVKTVVSDSVRIETTDGNHSILLDQNAITNGVDIRSDTKALLLSGDPSNNIAIQFFGGNIFVFNPGGNIVLSSSRLLDNGDDFQSQTMETITTKRVLNPANADYPELNNTDVGGLNLSSRLSILPDPAGTTIHSIIIDSGQANPDGRTLLIQNIGTAVGQTLTLANLSGTGTIGGLIQGPGDYIVPHGGGVIITFDSDSDVWFVRGI